MNEITTELKNWVMVFIDGSRKFITSAKASSLFSLPPEANKFDLDGKMYSLSSISKIITKEDFEEEYPKERVNVLPVWKEPEPYRSIEKTVTDNSKWLKGIIKGLKQFITENPESPKAMEMLKKYVKIYRQRYGELK